MNTSGDADLLVRSRAALLDALDALADHRDAVVVIGAQAIYLHAGGAVVALAEATKDSDLALDPRMLGERPLIEDAMRAAGSSSTPTGTNLAPGSTRRAFRSTSWSPKRWLDQVDAAAPVYLPTRSVRCDEPQAWRPQWSTTSTCGSER